MYRKALLYLKYVKYCVSASNGKGHGIHSPFVFDFITHVLNDCKNHIDVSMVVVPAIGKHHSHKYEKLIKKMIVYYPDCVVNLFGLSQNKEGMLEMAEKMFENVFENSIHIVMGIQVSRAAQKKWIEIKKNQKVTCSVDLFFIGILFFRKEFKEKLDFMIRF